MVAVGVVGYVETPFGLRTLSTVWAQHLSPAVKRRFYRRWYKSKKKAFSKHTKNYNTKNSRQERQATLKKMAKLCSVIRVLAHTQIHKTRVGQKKAHLIEIQVNGGTVPQKIAFAVRLFEKFIPV